MQNYNKKELEELEEESLKNLTGGSGPSDKCICSLLYQQTEKKTVAQSIKQVLGFGSRKRGRSLSPRSRVSRSRPKDLDILFDFAGKGITSKKVIVKKKGSCGKCACSDNDVIFRHSVANIEIVTPDLSSICPCPTSQCMPEKEQKNNIQVTIERVEVIDTEDRTLNEIRDTKEPNDTSTCGNGLKLIDELYTSSEAGIPDT